MQESLYVVDLTVNEIPNADRWLVELLCAEHREINPEVSACAVAKATFRKTRGTEVVINRAYATECSPRPFSLTAGNTQYTAPCGCCAWML